MLTRISKFTTRTFVRNVATVATGTAAAQAITMAFAPIVTRLYGPEVYGVLGVFIALVAVLTPIAALTYPIAIVLPKSDAEAKGLAQLSLYFAALLTILVALIIAVFNKSLVSLLQIEAIAPFLFLIPMAMFFSACLQVAQQWLIRKQQFKVTAKVAVAKAFIINSAKAGFGWFNPTATVLVILTTLGSALHSFMLAIGAKRAQKNRPTAEDAKLTPLGELAKRHRDFPFFRAPQVFINAASQSLPVLMLAGFFGPTAAGFYAIGKTVLGLPSQLIGTSVGDVFYPRIVKGVHNGENLTPLITKATLALAAVGVVPFGLVIAFGPWLFGFVFGAEWVTAGEYARWLALWLFFGFINKPSVVAVPVLGLQRGLLYYEILSTSSKLLALYFGFYFFSDDVFSVKLYSFFGVLAYVCLIIWVLYSSSLRKFDFSNPPPYKTISKET